MQAETLGYSIVLYVIIGLLSFYVAFRLYVVYLGESPERGRRAQNNASSSSDPNMRVRAMLSI